MSQKGVALFFEAYIVSSRDMSPKGDAPDMHRFEERGCVFSVPCCDSPPSFQVKEGIFYLVAKFVKFFIKGPLFHLGGLFPGTALDQQYDCYHIRGPPAGSEPLFR